MKKTLFLIFVLLGMCQARAQVISLSIDTDSPSFKTGDDVLSHLHRKYKNAPCKAYTFSQKNTHYRNDSITGHSEWYESIEFPDKFRIDFGEKAAGNFVIFKNDSSYRYKKGELSGRKYDENILLLLLGGMYYRDLQDVTARLHKKEFNTSVLSSQKWRKQPVYVIGALAGDTLSNQIWISKKTWRVVRIIEKIQEGHTMDMTFDEHREHCKGYVETKVTFRDNGMVEQVEEYYNIQTVESFPAEVFSLYR
jgi:outer membrane lipoprotein-sorting protein